MSVLKKEMEELVAQMQRERNTVNQSVIVPIHEVEEDIQHQIKDEVEELAYDTISVEEDQDEDGQIYTNINVDNFLEALFEDYRLEKK